MFSFALGTSASLLVTSALLVVTIFAIRNKNPTEMFPSVKLRCGKGRKAISELLLLW